MRVLVVCGSYPRALCGVGDYSYQLVEQLRQFDDVKVSVVTSVSPAVAGETDIYRAMPSWSLSEVRRLAALVQRIDPDLVHLQYPSSGYGEGLLPWFVPLLSRLLGKSIVQTWHEPYSRRHALKLLLKAVVGGGLIVVRPDFRGLLHPAIRWMTLGKQYRYIRSSSTMPICETPVADKERYRAEYLQGKERLVVFFGFLYPHKRVELLFELCDPATDKILIIGGVKDEEYFRMLESSSLKWGGEAEFLGFLPDPEVALRLAIADAVVLPFANGGGDWNTSIHAAAAQRTFVLTTSITREGYSREQNTYYAGLNAVQEMRQALARYAGTKRQQQSGSHSWKDIAEQHLLLYRSVS